MTEGSFYQPKRKSPTALTVVVLMHGAAIAALAMHKMEFAPTIFEPIDVIDIEDPLPPPPEVPPEPVKPQIEPPQHVSFVPKVVPIVPTPVPTPTVHTVDYPPIQYPATPVGTIEVPPSPPPPPPPPPAKKLEPARAKANLASYVSDADYPASAQRNEEQGTTRFRLTVGADGKVTDCTVTGSSGSSALDSTTCRIMKSRARFEPARDSSGNRTSDSVSSAIKWVLPAD